MDSTFDRFKVEQKGGYFSNTQWNESSFKKKNFHFPPEIKKEDIPKIPKGRPLFLREINKEVPPPDTYDVKRNVEFAKINPKQPCLFGHSF